MSRNFGGMFNYNLTVLKATCAITPRKMPASRKVSGRQMELLLDFVEQNRDIALGRCSRGPLGSQMAQRAWQQASLTLNSIPEGTTKTPEHWRRYWIELKAKTKAKAADSRRNASATGGGPNKLVPLSDIEERVLSIIGKVAVEGLPGVRIPFPIEESTPSTSQAAIPSTSQGAMPSTSKEPTSSLTQPSTSQTDPSIPQSTSPLPELVMDEEWLDDTMDTAPFSRLSTAADIQAPIQHTACESDLQTRERSPIQQILRESTQHRSPQQQRSRERTRRRSYAVVGVPRWALDLEERRVMAENRIARAVSSIASSLENIHNILADIATYVRRDI